MKTQPEWMAVGAPIVTIALGIWLMVAPAALGYSNTMGADVHRVLGPTIASFAAVSISHAMRSLRRVNLFTAACLVASTLALPQVAPSVVGIVTGVAVGLLALVRPRSGPRLGGGWRAVVRPET